MEPISNCDTNKANPKPLVVYDCGSSDSDYLKHSEHVKRTKGSNSNSDSRHKTKSHRRDHNSSSHKSEKKPRKERPKSHKMDRQPDYYDYKKNARYHSPENHRNPRSHERPPRPHGGSGRAYAGMDSKHSRPSPSMYPTPVLPIQRVTKVPGVHSIRRSIDEDESRHEYHNRSYSPYVHQSPKPTKLANSVITPTSRVVK